LDFRPIERAPDAFQRSVTGGAGARDSHRTLSSARLPISGTRLRLLGAAIGPGSTTAFVVGETRKSASSTTQAAVIFRRGP